MAASIRYQYVAVFFSCYICLTTSRLGKTYTNKEIHKYRDKVEKMFYHAYDGYIHHAYPYDELRPLTCDGHDTWGSYSLTLIDALDTLAVMGNYTEFRRVAKLISNMMNFDIDINASVFETNIRILGGLLSAHLLYKKAGMELEPGWPCSGPLLRLAEDVARRILPAFDTPTGMPYGTVNLRHGVPKGETTVTCTAGVGTFIIEFGTLSRLTGDPVFEKVAMRAMRALWNTRSSLGLVGNHIDVKTSKWTAVDFGIGGGIDSYFEYLVKAGIMFNIPELLEQFHEYHKAVKKYVKRDDWYMWANMAKGGITLPMFTSLDAYWPGILSMLGETDQAMKTLHNFHQVWKQYGFTPEYYNIPKTEAHKGREGYPLRPELIESVMYLYRATKDPFLLDIGVDIIESIEHSTRTECGYATVKDVNTHLLENRMESFFLAETTKYLYLLFDPDNFIHNNGSSGTVVQTPNSECVIDAGGYFFNTEAHPIDSAAVYCCSTEKKADDAELQAMHDNLDLLTLLDVLDSSEEVFGEKLKLKTEKDKHSKNHKLKGETAAVKDHENHKNSKNIENNENSLKSKHSSNSKIKNEILNKNENKDNLKSTIENSVKDKSEKVTLENSNLREQDNIQNEKTENILTVVAQENQKQQTEGGNEAESQEEVHSNISKDISKEMLHSDNPKDQLKEGLNSNVPQQESIVEKQSDISLQLPSDDSQESSHKQSENSNTSHQVQGKSPENKESRTAEVNVTGGSSSKLLSVVQVTDKQEGLPSTNTLVQLLSLLSGKQITKGDNKEWQPDVNHLYQIIQFYPSVYKSKPELMMCKAQPFHMRWSVNGEMFENEDDE